MAVPSKEIQERARLIKLIIMDCDGVMTDGRIILLPGGDEIKFFDVKDGHGIRMAVRAGLITGIITGRKSEVLRARARDLGVSHLYEHTHIKIQPYDEILVKEGLTDQEACYIGDDVTDIPLLRRVGLAIAVTDAVEEVKQFSHYITSHPGGRGAIREVIELILKSQGKWDDALERYIK